MGTPSVGLFFCVDNTVYARRMLPVETEPRAEGQAAPLSHRDFWDAELAERFPGVEYDHFPRGRVALKNGFYTVRIDRCLDRLPAIEAILEAFDIVGEPWHVEYDKHYQCAACQMRAHGALVFDSAQPMSVQSADPSKGQSEIFYRLFGQTLGQAFEQMCGRKNYTAWLAEDGTVQVGHKQGTPLSIALSAAEQRALAIACRYALAEAQGVPLVLFHPADGIEPSEAAHIMDFLQSRPKEKVVVSAPFSGSVRRTDGS